MVSIIAPRNQSTVSGVVVIEAHAEDNVGVKDVLFRANGKRIPPVDAEVPYRVTWDTRRLENGAYRVTARARDAAGNESTAVLTLIVKNRSGGANAPVTNINQ